MPEGPSIVIIKEQLLPVIKGKKIIAATGNAKIDMQLLVNKKLMDVRSWGKQLLLVLPAGKAIRIHLLMFGSWSMDEQTKPDRSLRLKLRFSRHEIFFYTCSVRILENKPDELYDWEADTMSDQWNPAKARKKLKAADDTMVCDALLDQQIFSGVGNIIKNEVLFRVRLHPETVVKDIPPRKLAELIKEARNYCFDFLEWKKAFTLKKHWLVHTKKECPRCKIKLTKNYPGKTRRRTFFCSNCQVKY